MTAIPHARTWARIESSTVMELLQTTHDPATLFHLDLHWVDVTGEAVHVGWSQTETGFSPPAPQAANTTTEPSFASLKANFDALAAQFAALQATAR